MVGVVVAMMLIVVIVMLVMLVLARIMPFLVNDVLVLGDAFEVSLELTLALALWQRTELHVDVTTRHARILIDMPHGQQVFLDLLGQQVTKLLMRHLPSAELQLDAHLVPFCQEVFSMRDLNQVIMRVDADAEFHFLHLAALLVLVSLLLVLLLDVLVFAVVDDLADGWVGIRSHFHQIQTTLFGDANGLRSGNDAELMMTILLDNTDLGRTDALIDTGLIDKTTVGTIPTTRTIAAAWTESTTTTRPLIAASRTSRSGRSGGSGGSQSRPGWTRRRSRSRR